MYQDPLYKMRHSLIGLLGALAISVVLAAVLGAFVGDLVVGTYGARVAFYSGILVYIIIGAIVVFMKIARHETKPATVTRVLLWAACLWGWPGVLLLLRGAKQQEGTQ
jgi:MFS family permease